MILSSEFQVLMENYNLPAVNKRIQEQSCCLMGLICQVDFITYSLKPHRELIFYHLLSTYKTNLFGYKGKYDLSDSILTISGLVIHFMNEYTVMPSDVQFHLRMMDGIMELRFKNSLGMALYLKRISDTPLFKN